MRSADMIVQLIRSVMTDTPLALQNDEPLNYEELFALSAVHDMTALVSQGLYQNGLFPKDVWGKQFKIAQIGALGRCTQLDRDRALICQVLTEANIPYVLLKGSVLKDFYPESYMRTQCDIDILVKEEMLFAAQEIFTTQLGFTHVETGNHDMAFNTPRGVRIELHYALLEEEKARVDALLATAWDHVTYREDNPCHGEFSWEFFVFYHIAHMEKHFIQGGCGLKPVIDLWLLYHTIGFDVKKAEALFAQCGLVTFFRESLHLCRVWFAGEPHTKLTQAMEDYIFGAGVYGALENEVAISQVKRGGKVGHLISKIFIDYPTMKLYYPSVKRVPFLFPFYQVARWAHLFFSKERKRVLRAINVSNTVDDKKRREVAFLCKKLEIM